MIDPVPTWIWSLCIDYLLVSGSLLVLRNSLQEESTRFGWLVLSVFTGVSIAFTVAVNPDTWINRAFHAIPTITLMVSVENLLSIIRSDLSTPLLVQEDDPYTRLLHRMLLPSRCYRSTWIIHQSVMSLLRLI